MSKQFIRIQLGVLIDLLGRKIDGLQQVIQLTRGQRMMFEQSKGEQFHELVKNKEGFMEEIQTIDQEFIQKYQQLREVMITESGTYKEEIQKIQQGISKISDLMQMLYKEEKSIKEGMQRQMKQMHEQMRQVQHSPDYVANVYKKQPPKRP